MPDFESRPEDGAHADHPPHGAVLPCVAATVWLALPEEPPAQSGAPSETAPVAVQASADEGARTPDDRGTYQAGDAPEIAGHLGAAISAQAPLPAPSAPPRFTTPPRTQFSNAAPNRALSGTHIRVLSGGAASGTAPASGGPVVAATPAATAPGTITLEVDPSLHDPAVWAENGQPMSPAQEALKAQIADEFEATVAAAVADAATVNNGLVDQAWREARTRANWEYQKFFGDAAANRAAINAGRATVSPP